MKPNQQNTVMAANILPDDAILLASVCEGSHHAFSELVARHATRYYRVAYRFTGNRQDAEDMVQNAFIKLWERPEMWQAEKNVRFTTWFYRVVVNMCLDSRKKYKPLPLNEDAPIMDESQGQEAALADVQEQLLLKRELQALPERQLMALNLCVYEELSNQEAADIMGLNLKALQSLLIRAKATLKQRMQAYI